MAGKWHASALNAPTINSTAGRNGKGALHCDNFGDGTPLFQPSSSSSTYFVCFAIKLNNISSGAGIAQIFNDNGDQQASLSFSSSGQLVLYRSDGTTLDTISGIFSAGVWAHIQWKYTPSSSCATDSNIIRVNDAVVSNLAATTQTSVRTSHYNCKGFQLGSFSGALNAFTCYIDDVYLLDDSGSNLNDFQGDCTIDYVIPVSNGFYNQFSPTGAASNWQAVPDNNGDTSYCSSGSLVRQTFRMDSVASGIDSIVALQAVTTLKKVGAGSHNIHNLIRIGGTDYEQADYAPGTQYAQNVNIMPVNPDTTSAWTVSDVATLEAGIRIVS